MLLWSQGGQTFHPNVCLSRAVRTRVLAQLAIPSLCSLAGWKWMLLEHRSKQCHVLRQQTHPWAFSLLAVPGVRFTAAVSGVEGNSAHPRAGLLVSRPRPPPLWYFLVLIGRCIILPWGTKVQGWDILRSWRETD